MRSDWPKSANIVAGCSSLAATEERDSSTKVATLPISVHTDARVTEADRPTIFSFIKFRATAFG